MTRTQFILSLPFIGLIGKVFSQEKHTTKMVGVWGNISQTVSIWDRELTHEELQELINFHPIISEKKEGNNTTLYIDGKEWMGNNSLVSLP